MKPVAGQQRKPLGLFPDRPAPRLHDRVTEVLRVHHDSRRTEEAYVLAQEQPQPGASALSNLTFRVRP